MFTNNIWLVYYQLLNDRWYEIYYSRWKRTRKSKNVRRRASSMMPPTISVRREPLRSRGPPVRSVSCRSTMNPPCRSLDLNRQPIRPMGARNSATRRKRSRAIQSSILSSIPFSAELSNRRRRLISAVHSTTMRFELGTHFNSFSLSG